MTGLVLDPEIAAAAARDVARYGARASLSAGNLAEMRVDFLRRRLERGRAGGPHMRTTHEREADLPGRRLRIRIHVPEAASAHGPALVYFHGGGWVWGSIDTHDRIMRELAHRSGLRVVGVDYRKAPEHPFPAPFDDCVASISWLRDQADALGIDGGRLAFGGDSAGANLALAAGIAEAEAGRVPLGLLLFYGTFDDDLATESYGAEFGDGRFGLSRRDMGLFLDWYLGERDRGSAIDGRARPLHGRLELLGHTFLLGCGLDPLRDDTRRLAAALAGHGVSFEFTELATANHGFLALAEDVALARHALARAAAYLARAAMKHA
jgi:acetyl esterase